MKQDYLQENLKMKFKYKNQKLNFTIKIVNQDNEEWYFNNNGKTNKEEQILVLEQLIKQLRGENVQ